MASGICFVLYMAIAVAGTHAFGVHVDKNVLVSLSSERGLQLLPLSLVAAVFVSMSLIMICIFPLNAYGLRVSLHQLIFGGDLETTRQRWLGSLVLVTICTLIAVAVDDLGALFRVTGATTGVYIMFLLPGALLLRIAYRFSPTSVLLSYDPPSPDLSDGYNMDADSSSVGKASPLSPSSMSGERASSDLASINVVSSAAIVFAGLCIGICGTAAVFIG